MVGVIGGCSGHRSVCVKLISRENSECFSLKKTSSELERGPGEQTNGAGVCTRTYASLVNKALYSYKR